MQEVVLVVREWNGDVNLVPRYLATTKNQVQEHQLRYLFTSLNNWTHFTDMKYSGMMMMFQR